MTIGEYLDHTRGATSKNPFQRKRIASSKTVYALLREDILKGCVIPPVVLALTANLGDYSDLSRDQIVQKVKEHAETLLILDGLQRTFTLLDLESKLNDDERTHFRNIPLRVEVYLGLNRIGILYRMLTLNTGQTPMSLRQQIEMLYSDYLDIGLHGVVFVREVDETHATLENELNFRETIEGFNAYLERDELPLDRSDLLDNIKSLENLSHENSSHDLFSEYVLAWQAFYKKSIELCNYAEYVPDENAPEVPVPWGRTAAQIFRKPQVMTGFGAAIGKLKDHNKIGGLDEVAQLVNSLTLDGVDPIQFIEKVNGNILWINKNTKKIGNAQRMFFQFYFRDLFNKESETYLSLHGALTSALHKVESQLF